MKKENKKNTIRNLEKLLDQAFPGPTSKKRVISRQEYKKFIKYNGKTSDKKINEAMEFVTSRLSKQEDVKAGKVKLSDLKTDVHRPDTKKTPGQHRFQISYILYTAGDGGNNRGSRDVRDKKLYPLGLHSVEVIAKGTNGEWYHTQRLFI